jgi:hypothetical protein
VSQKKGLRPTAWLQWVTWKKLKLLFFLTKITLILPKSSCGSNDDTQGVIEQLEVNL